MSKTQQYKRDVIRRFSVDRVSSACGKVIEALEGRLMLAAHIVGSPTVYPTIQSAVNAAPAGATITVDPGTYPELVSIYEPLTIDGAQAGVDARSNARAANSANEWHDRRQRRLLLLLY
jgi:pectin methylesterase-like acyl-CoA thioesterase